MYLWHKQEIAWLQSALFFATTPEMMKMQTICLPKHDGCTRRDERLFQIWINFVINEWNSPNPVTHCDVEHPVGLAWSAYNLQTWTISSKIAIKVSRTDPCNLLQFVCWQNAWNVMNLMLPTTKWFPCNRPPAIALGAVTKILAFPNKNYRRNFLRNW